VNEHPSLPGYYFIDESDPDVVVLHRADGSFVAAFSAQGATKEGIRQAAEEDYRELRRSREPKRDGSMPD
jgi:hypothetical protein